MTGDIFDRNDRLGPGKSNPHLDWTRNGDTNDTSRIVTGIATKCDMTMQSTHDRQKVSVLVSQLLRAPALFLPTLRLLTDLSLLPLFALRSHSLRSLLRSRSYRSFMLLSFILGRRRFVSKTFDCRAAQIRRLARPQKRFQEVAFAVHHVYTRGID
jgi:hypothetical protein